MAKKKAKYYAVRNGRTLGVFTSWADCQESIDGFSKASYKSFETREEAEIFCKTGDVVNPTKFYGIAKGRIPGVYTSWAKAQEQVNGLRREKVKFRGFETIEDAKAFVADIKGVNIAQVPVFRSHFEQFANGQFRPVEGLPLLDQFNALALLQGWEPESKEWHEQRTEAIEREFQYHFLAPLLDIEAEEGASDAQNSTRRRMACYKILCEKLGKDEPQSIPEARNILQAKPWVNIIDLIDYARTGERFQTWNNFDEFRQYTNARHKWINLQKAKENEFLSALLVNFSAQYHDDEGGGEETEEFEDDYDEDEDEDEDEDNEEQYDEDDDEEEGDHDEHSEAQSHVAPSNLHKVNQKRYLEDIIDVNGSESEEDAFETMRSPNRVKSG